MLAVVSYAQQGQQSLTQDQRIKFLADKGVSPKTLQELSGVVGKLTSKEFQYFQSNFFKGDAVNILASQAKGNVQR